VEQPVLSVNEGPHPDTTNYSILSILFQHLHL